MAISKRRVAVIGAGPAGAIATDALVKEQAFDTIRVFERRNAVGGTWLYDPDLQPGIPSLRLLVEQKTVVPQIPSTFPCETLRDETANSHQARYWDSGAHEHLHSNLPPGVMCFSQEPIPEIISERSLAKYGPSSPFRHRELIREWIEGVLIRGKPHGLIQFNTTVELAEYDQKSAEWKLTLRKEQPGQETDYWWQEKFDTLVVASGHFYRPYIPDIPGLLEFDETFPGRLQHSKHYRNVEEYRDKISAFDALHDIRLVSKLPVISSLRKPNAVFTEAAFTHPDIVVKPQIKSFSPDSGRITFSDGSWIDNVDVVLFATGYDFSVPFLPDLKGVNKRIPGLYQHVFKTDNPSLAFIGMVAGGFGIRIYEWQAVAAARVLAGHAKLPPREEMEKWEQDRLALKGEGAPFWTLMPDFEEHFEAYRALAGDPAEGTLGRVLPKYDPAWADEFWEFVRKRIKWWQEAAARDAAKH